MVRLIKLFAVKLNIAIPDLFYSQFFYLSSLSCINIYSIRLSKFSLNKFCTIFPSFSAICVSAYAQFLYVQQMKFCKKMPFVNAAISFQNKSLLVLLLLFPEPWYSSFSNVFLATKNFISKMTLLYDSTTEW